MMKQSKKLTYARILARMFLIVSMSTALTMEIGAQNPSKVVRFEEDGRMYLLYSVAGESGIAISEIIWE